VGECSGMSPEIGLALSVWTRRLEHSCADARKSRWLLHKRVPSEGFKTMTACPRTSSRATVSKSCYCPQI
jgi:hypothetical protein